MDVITITQWAAFFTGLCAAVTAYLRYLSKTRNANSGETTATDVNNKLLINLKNEISRLEKVIEKLNNRIGLLEKNISTLRNLEISASLDFGALEMIIKSFPCASCVNQGEAFVQLSDVVERMAKRREIRQTLIGSEEIAACLASGK